MFAGVLGTTNLNVTIPGFGSAGSRTYATVQDLNTELVNARVWIGYHFRTSTVVGEDLGHSVPRGRCSASSCRETTRRKATSGAATFTT